MKPITLEGTLTLSEYPDPQSKEVLSVYRMTDAVVAGVPARISRTSVLQLVETVDRASFARAFAGLSPGWAPR